MSSREAQAARRVAVIGAGIAGLAAAHCLRRRGVDVDILERARHAGGAVRSVLKEDRYLLELGPNAFLASAEPMLKLARELSIDPQIVGTPGTSSRRFIRARGRMHELPTGPLAFLTSGLLSPWGKLRLLAEVGVRSRSEGEETLAGFVTRRAGREVLENIVDPFVSGVWAGDPKRLEAKSVLPKLVEVERECGSVLRGMKRLSGDVPKRGLLSFRWGMGTMTARLEEEMKSRLRLGHPAASIERTKGGLFRVRAEGRPSAEFDAVIVAAPAPAAAAILAELDPEMATPLAAISYAPVAVVHTAFAERDLPGPIEGFGVLIARGEGIRLLGSIWSSSIFPGRCPKGEALLTNFIGGATDPEAADLSDEEISAEVLAGLKEAMAITAKPLRTFVKRVGQAIPQYTVGHGGRIRRIRERIEGLPGVFLTGSYMDGVSVSDTIAHARAEADRALAYLKQR